MSSLSDARKRRDAEVKAAIDQYGMGSAEHLAVLAKWAKFDAKPSSGFSDGYIEKALGGQYSPGSPSRGLGGVIDRCVQQAGRSTIQWNARRDPAKVRWARMPSGKCCSFCLMLASKGAVFFSEYSAGGNGDGTNWYHENCRCQPVPVWEGQKPPYDADALYDMYLKSVENAGPGATTEQILEQIRRDWPDRVTDPIWPDVPWILQGGAEDWPTWLQPVSGERWHYILSKHGFDASVIGKSRFWRDTDIANALYDTIMADTRVIDKASYRLLHHHVNGQMVNVPLGRNGRYWFVINCYPE